MMQARPSGSLMAMRYRVQWAPKRGYADDEYEDYWAADPATGRFAMADGATETSFADIWAQLLVIEFAATATAPLAEARAQLAELQRRWWSDISARKMPDFAAEKAAAGACATFLGLIVEPPGDLGDGRWRSLAIGDTCVFHERDDRLLAAFPIERADDFNSRPNLLGSRMPLPRAMDRKRWRIRHGALSPNDRLLLMTDALAEWFLRRCELGEQPWRTLDQLGDVEPEQFAAWLKDVRERREIRNDDVTLLIVRLDDP